MGTKYRNIVKLSFDHATPEDVNWFKGIMKELSKADYDKLRDKFERIFREGLYRGYRNKISDTINGKVVNPEHISRKKSVHKYPFDKMQPDERVYLEIPEGKDPWKFQSIVMASAIQYIKRHDQTMKFSTRMTGIGISERKLILKRVK